jgi:sugar/nucleoside kinase (ribokinase family)
MVPGTAVSILVVGSVALDAVTTPFGRVSDVLGGSATYFAVAASFFADVRVVAVVGEEFPEEHLAFLKGRSIDLEGLKKVSGRTFRWVGEYGYDLNEARTVATELNVFADFRPEIPQSYRGSELVFLANIDPDLQREVLQQVRSPRLVAADTMNYWIGGKPDSLRETLKSVDVLLINDAETRQLAGDPNLVRAARTILGWGPTSLVIKRGEYGALMVRGDGWFSAPALPLDSVFDPTGAGDSFAGGFVGYLASTMTFDEANVRKAIIMGSVMASFTVEAFSLDRLRRLTYPEIEERYTAFKRLAQFEDL